MICLQLIAKIRCEKKRKINTGDYNEIGESYFNDIADDIGFISGRLTDWIKNTISRCQNERHLRKNGKFE
tara:strand:+ start:405 stop:614 length:210 start_codon:yes stop_codon:yes gene_type:complete